MKTKNIFRTLLMAAFLLAGANSVKAGENLPYNNANGSSYVDINFGQFDSAEVGDTLRITYKITNYGNEWWHPDWNIKLTGQQSTFKEVAITKDGYFDFVLDADFFVSINTTDPNNRSLNISGTEVNITKIEIVPGVTPGPHAINIAENITNGVITSDKTSAEKDETITLTAVSAVGYKLKNFIVNGKTTVATVTSTQVNEDGTITTIGTFAMLGKDVTVSAEFIDKNIIWEGSSGDVTINKSYFDDITPNCTLRVWADKKIFEIRTVNGTVLFNSQNQSVIMYDSDLNTYYKENSYFEFTLSEDQLSAIQESGLYLKSDWGNSKITKVMLIPNSSSTPSTKPDVTLTYSATSVSTTTASIGQALTNAPTLTVSPDGLEGITYSSSVESVATVAADGTVTVVGAGTTTITATFAETDTYKGASASYTLTVTEALYAITLSEITNGQLSVSATEAAANTTVTITATPNEGYKLSTVTVTAGENIIEVSGTGNTRTFTMPAQDVTINAKFKEIQTVDAEINSSTGFATFCCNQPLDFTGITTLEAYYAKTVEDGNVYLIKVYGIVPDGTGLIIKGTTGITKIPVAESKGEKIEGNLLIGVTENKEVHAVTDYVLTVKNGTAVFAQTGVNAATVKAGHAYLTVSNAQARTRTIGIGGEGTTDIENTFIDDNEQGEEVIYNLNGQRIKNPRKGLYIINGKKVLVK